MSQAAGHDADEGTGVLVLTVWAETGSEGGFRARLLLGAGLGETPRTVYARTPEAVLAIAESWLAEVTAGAWQRRAGRREE